MDLAKFYSWKRVSVIAALSKAPQTDECCKQVFDDLYSEGLITQCQVEGVRWGDQKHSNMQGTNKTKRVVKLPGYKLNKNGLALVPQAKRQAERLLNELLKENEKLVRKLVNQAFVKTLNFTEEEDMYQAGLMGFVRALSDFDPQKCTRKGVGASFATYVRGWIRDYTQQDTRRQQPIKHPRRFGMPYSVYKKAEHIKATTGVEATAEQLGTYECRSKGKSKTVQVTDELLLRWAASQNSVMSMDTVGNAQTNQSWVQSDGDYVVRGDLPDPESSRGPEGAYLKAEQQVHANALIEGLDEKEQMVIAAIRDGEGSNRKVGILLGVGDSVARDYKLRLFKKLQGRAERTS